MQVLQVSHAAILSPAIRSGVRRIARASRSPHIGDMRIPLILASLLVVTPLACVTPPAFAASGTAAGLRIAQQCKSCHSIGVRGASPNPASPPFRTLAQRYPLENLQESLVEGIVVGHAEGMPSVKLTPRQAGDFLRYLKSIQRK